MFPQVTEHSPHVRCLVFRLPSDRVPGQTGAMDERAAAQLRVIKAVVKVCNPEISDL
jgi:hypothetical protein